MSEHTTTGQRGLTRRRILGGAAAVAGAGLIGCDASGHGHHQVTGRTVRWHRALPYTAHDEDPNTAPVGFPYHLAAGGHELYVGHLGQLSAVRASDGKRRWASPHGPHETVDLAQRLTPVVGAGAVYTLRTTGESATVCALDRGTGRLAWRYAPGRLVGPPAIEDLLLATSSGDGVHALDTRNGRRRWAFTGPEGFESSVAVATNRIYAVGNSGAPYAVDGTSGHQIWRGEPASTAPLNARLGVGRQHVYLTGIGRLRAVDAKDGHTAWTLGSDLLSTTEGQPVVVGTTVHLLGTDQQTAGASHATTRIAAVDAAGGRVRWQAKVAQPGQRVTTSPAVGGGVVAVASGAGRLIVFDSDTGRHRWTATIRTADGRPAALSSPAVADHTVSVLSRDHDTDASAQHRTDHLWAFSA